MTLKPCPSRAKVAGKIPRPALVHLRAALLRHVLETASIACRSVAMAPASVRHEIGWDDAQFGWINFSFQLRADALMFPVAGRLLDRFWCCATAPRSAS